MGLWSWLTGKEGALPVQTEREIAAKDEELAQVLDEFAAVEKRAQRDINGVRRELDGLRAEFGVRRERGDVARSLRRALENGGGS